MNGPHDNENMVPVKRGRVDSLRIFEVTDHELEELARGGPASQLLNFALFLLSGGISFFIALLTTSISSLRTYCVFVIVCSVCTVGAITLLLIWRVRHVSLSGLVKRIKQRMPADDTIDRDAQQKDAVDRS